MALLTIINGSPLFTTVEEALNWAIENDCSGYHTHEYEGQTGYMGCLDHSQASDSRLKSHLILNIPPQEAETVYHIFFKSVGSTSYDSYLPTESNPWVINQLPNPTVTFKFNDEEGFSSISTTTTTHLPKVSLNSGSKNDGSITVNITTIAKRGSIQLSLEKTLKPTISIGEISNESGPEILASNLTASVDTDNRTGIISGTITLGESGLRSSNVTFSPLQFFRII